MNDVDLGQLISPATTRRLGGSRTLPILSMTMHGGLVDQSKKFSKRIASIDLSPYKVVVHGQLVVGFPIDEGVLSIQRKYPEAVVSPAYGVWDLDESQVHGRYLEIFLQSGQAIGYYRAHLRGSTARRRSLPAEVLLALKVPLPPLPEQRRIASILDRVTGVVGSRLAAHSRLSRLLLECYDRNFVGRDSPLVPFKDVLSTPLRNGVSPSTKGKFDGEVLTLSAITRGRFDGDARKIGMFDRPIDPAKVAEPGELLICRGNGNQTLVGRAELVADVGAGIAFPDTMIAARLNEGLVDKEFVRTAWNGANVRRQLEAGARTTNGTYKVNQSLLESVLIPMPQLAHQRAFGQLVAAARQISVTQEAHLAKLDELFASLQHRAFRGEL